MIKHMIIVIAGIENNSLLTKTISDILFFTNSKSPNTFGSLLGDDQSYITLEYFMIRPYHSDEYIMVRNPLWILLSASHISPILAHDSMYLTKVLSFLPISFRFRAGLGGVGLTAYALEDTEMFAKQMFRYEPAQDFGWGLGMATPFFFI